VLFAGVAGSTLFSGSAHGLIAGGTQIDVQLPAALPSETIPGAVPAVLDLAGHPVPARAHRRKPQGRAAPKLLHS